MLKSNRAVLGVVVLILIAGCAGPTTGDSTTATDDAGVTASAVQISDIQISGQTGEAVISFNRTVSSATLSLVDENRTTIASQSVDNPRNQTRLALPDRSGNYSIRLTQNSTVLDSQTVTVAAPTPQVNVTPTWNGNTLANLSVDVTNDGDLTTDASVSVYRLQTPIANTSSRTVSPGETARFDLGDGGNVYRTNATGEITLRAVVETSASTVEREITTTVRPGEIQIRSLSPKWDEDELQSVEYTLRNAGDTSATGTVTITASDDTITTGTNRSLQGGITDTFSYEASYDTDTDETTVNLTVMYNGTTVSESITNETEVTITGGGGGGGGGY
ncbi:MAG: hypothetical protein A07HN63_00011 [uncultured archaeon A07HN63]|nr:MAG: hypothetical protein A07HN63_00011 [uncultured archaeon A07HN63]